MNFEEHAGKELLRASGLATPAGKLVTTVDEARAAAEEIGPCVVKAQATTGKRGKAGGIKLADTADQAADHASKILGMDIGGHVIERLLVEQQVPIARELYAAILNDPNSKGPLLLLSSEGGMDIEEIAESHPEKLHRLEIDVNNPPDANAMSVVTANLDLDVDLKNTLAEALSKLWDAYWTNDAELMEINPLVVTQSGDIIALDCKFTLDDSAVKRQPDIASKGSPDKKTALEKRAEEHDLKFIELEGNVGVLANGAGLTMTTMDAIAHYGGRPANFLEIGGESYTKGKEALELVLANPGVKALLVNFCGAFARCDVMTEGLLNGWAQIEPDVPVFFTIHGTGEDEAIAMVRERLGIEPFDIMDDAVKAAVEAAHSSTRETGQ